MPRQGRIRIIEQEEQPRFSSGLEARARDLVSRTGSEWDDDPVRMLERQISLAVEEIDRARSVHAAVLKSALRNECDMDTELIQMEQRTPRYSPYRFPEREKIQRRLQWLDQERRRLVLGYEQRMAELRQRLLDLLERQGQAE